MPSCSRTLKTNAISSYLGAEQVLKDFELGKLAPMRLVDQGLFYQDVPRQEC